MAEADLRRQKLENEHYYGKDVKISHSGIVAEKNDLINKELQNEFNEYIRTKLTPKDEKHKDYHPHSDNQVLDLIHPSLYCYVRDVSVVNEELLPSDSPLLYKSSKLGRTSTFV